MNFYNDAAFFIVVGIAMVPALILGLAEKRIRYYGFAVNCVMLAFLYCTDLAQGLFFLLFLAISVACMKLTLASWQSGKKSLLLYRLCLAANLAPLVIYKVSGLFEVSLLGFMGISYVTFKAVQVLIEIRDGLIDDMSLFDYLYFITFFATITSGPIDRSRRFIEDANKKLSRQEYMDLLTRGILLFLAGAVYMLVISTYLQTKVSITGLNTHKPLILALISAGINSYEYGLYMFFDFAGYSMMALGISYIFGIRTPRNFRAPFAALDIKDFWNRWHITLSFWLRDFVFMRFTRTCMKHKVFKDRLTTACTGYIVNMMVMGAWHGLTVDYLLYGLYHGLLLAGTDYFQKKSKFYKAHKNDLWFKCVSWFITLNLVMLGFSLFSGQVSAIVGGLINGR